MCTKKGLSGRIGEVGWWVALVNWHFQSLRLSSFWLVVASAWVYLCAPCGECGSVVVSRTPGNVLLSSTFHLRRNTHSESHPTPPQPLQSQKSGAKKEKKPETEFQPRCRAISSNNNPLAKATQPPFPFLLFPSHYQFQFPRSWWKTLVPPFSAWVK